MLAASALAPSLIPRAQSQPQMGGSTQIPSRQLRRLLEDLLALAEHKGLITEQEGDLVIVECNDLESTGECFADCDGVFGPVNPHDCPAVAGSIGGYGHDSDVGTGKRVGTVASSTSVGNVQNQRSKRITGLGGLKGIDNSRAWQIAHCC